jgi:Asp-tRNA(Asn)/Glu-tRNA(Gln) amidotransferase A subunit family amidase
MLDWQGFSMGLSEIVKMDGLALSHAIQSKQASCVEVMNAYLDHIDALNPKVNAIVSLQDRGGLVEQAKTSDAELARGEHRGWMHGFPQAIKDLTATKGIRTTQGSRIFKDFVPAADAIMVERMKRAGAIIIGKTNTPEFGCKGVTDNLIFGHTRNPWRLDRIAGGSSGGAAAAVAAGLGPLAEGSDLAGSIRIPAAVCGVVGLKPSLGRVPRSPSLNGWTGMSHVGPITRTVADAALALSVWAGPDERDPQSLPATAEDSSRAAEGGARGLRVAWSADLGYAAVDREVREITGAAVRAFATLGALVEDAHPGFADPMDLLIDLTAPYRAAAMADHLPKWGDQMDPFLHLRIDHGEKMSAVEWERATHRRTALSHTVRRFFERVDLLVTPTTSVAAFPIGLAYPAEIEGRRIENQLQWFPFTFPFSITGQPAITVPCGFTAEGLPVGLQIVGPRHGDALVLRAAAAFEAARPWAQRRPGIE